jgi:hypothetical protein
MQFALQLAQELLALPSVSKHDTRFDDEVAVLSSSAGLDEAIALIESRMGPAAKAPKDELPGTLETLAASIGGIRGGQTLYVHELGDGKRMYAAFWPWSGGVKITIKLGVRAG